MIDQLEMFQAQPEDNNVQWLERLLEQKKEWLSASEILSIAGRQKSDSQKRYIRELASASSVIISGQNGYRHIRHATAGEIDHAVNWLLSQAGKMQLRAFALRKSAHQVVG